MENCNFPIEKNGTCDIVFTMEFNEIKNNITISGGSIVGGNANNSPLVFPAVTVNVVPAGKAVLAVTTDTEQSVTTGNKHDIVFTVTNNGGAPVSGLEISKYPWGADVTLGHEIIKDCAGLTMGQSCAVTLPMVHSLSASYQGDKSNEVVLQYGRIKAANADEIDLPSVKLKAEIPDNPKKAGNRIPTNKVTIANYSNTSLQFRDGGQYHGTPFLIYDDYGNSGDDEYPDYLKNQSGILASNNIVELKPFATSTTNLGGDDVFGDRYQPAFRLSIQTSAGIKIGLLNWEGWDYSRYPYAPKVSTCNTQSEYVVLPMEAGARSNYIILANAKDLQRSPNNKDGYLC